MRRTNVSSGKRIFFLGLIASLVVTAAIAIGVLLFGEFDETAGQILLTTAALSLFSLVALPAGVLLDQRRALPLAYVTLGLAVAALAATLAVIWRDWESEGGEGFWKVLVTLAAAAGASAQAAATTSRLRPGDSATVRRLYVGSLALAAVFAVLVAAAAWGEIDSSGFYRVLGAVAVADILLVVVQSVARRLGGDGEGAPAGPPALRVTGPPDVLEAAIPELERRGLTVERRR